MGQLAAAASGDTGAQEGRNVAGRLWIRGQEYGTSAREAAKAVTGKCVYVACHVNAGGGSYGLVCYDKRSGAGKHLSDAVSSELEKLVGKSRQVSASLGKSRQV